MRKRRHLLIATSALLLLSAYVLADAPVASNLRAEYRRGQVFLTWSEPEGLEGVRFQVRIAAEPITWGNLASAETVADHIRPHSATDWWLNPETYGAPVEPGPDGVKPLPPPEGWIVEEGGARLAPNTGLFVHTVTARTAGERYFAVLALSDETSEPLDTPQLGANSLAAPVVQEVAPIEPIWQGDPAQKPDFAAGAGLPLDLILHAKRGRGGMEWLAFGDGELGWRDGLPLKFGAEVRAESVVVRPTDRSWIARMFPEGRDECQRLTPAIHTF